MAIPTTPDAVAETTGANGEQAFSENEILSGPGQNIDGEWIASGSGTNEFYFEPDSGSVTVPSPTSRVQVAGSPSMVGTVGGLPDHDHAFADNDSIGSDRLYIRDDSGNPDSTGVTVINMIATEYVEVTSIDNTDGDEIRVEYQDFDTGLWNASTSQVAITGTSMKFTIEDLPSDRGIQYRAIVIDTDASPDDESDPSETATIRSAPETPWVVTVQEGEASDEKVVSWNGSTDYPHRVWETGVADPARLVGTVPAGTFSITDDGDGAGLSGSGYIYTVRSVNEEHDKLSGAAVSAGVQPDRPTLSIGNIGNTVATLTGSAFNDVSGDSHASSQWQVTTDADTGFASPEIDVTSASDLTSYLATELTADTDYRARVRYKDDSGDATTEWSEWSTVQTFSTTDQTITGTAAVVAIGGGSNRKAILVGEAA